AGGAVVTPAEDAAGPHRHAVSRTDRDTEAASGADILLDRGCRTLRLHVPQPVAARLGVLHATEDALHIERLGFRIATTGAARGRHAPQSTRATPRPGRPCRAVRDAPPPGRAATGHAARYATGRRRARGPPAARRARRRAPRGAAGGTADAAPGAATPHRHGRPV